MTTKQAQRSWDQMNATAAHAILETPWRYGGLDGFAATWARMLLARLENQQKLWQPKSARQMVTR
jgi:hypothetical protein